MNSTKRLLAVKESIRAAKKRLADLMASDRFSIDMFGSATAEIAKLQGEQNALDLIILRRQNEVDDATILAELLETVLRGADDSWSGRGNEVKRAAHDGFVSVVSALSDSIKYGK